MVIKDKRKFPEWLRYSMPSKGMFFDTCQALKKYKINTVCEEAKCPNRGICFTKKTATFLALGKECSRNCSFCDIAHSETPKPLDVEEPEAIARVVLEMGIKHAVVTMVTRDDLIDGGADQIAKIVSRIRKYSLGTTIEVLVSDFCGEESSIDIVLGERPEIFSHNIETVRRLSSNVRDRRANYDRSLGVLSYAKRAGKSKYIKSSILVGLGEEEEEVRSTMYDLYQSGCDVVVLGQYLMPDKKKRRVKSFVTPLEFKAYEEYGYKLGFKYVQSAPFARSSFNALEILRDISSGPIDV